MPRTTTTIAIFIASPSDVSSEREVVSQAISEWNQISGRSRSIHFELLRWENTVSAGFGQDGQDVVNTQIGDDYDALIGIFWTRVGTETPRSISGSIEEYERALVRYRETGDVEIAFFFKNALISVSDLDLGQVQAVRDLKKRLQSDGAFYKEFTDDSLLRFEINLLLDRLARKFAVDGGSNSGSIAPLAKSALPGAINEELPARNDDIGFLDVTESLQQHTELSQAFLKKMTKAMNVMTSETQKVSAEMEELAKLGNVGAPVMRPLVARVSEAMNTFSAFMESGATDYAEHSMAIANDTRSLIDLSREFTHNDKDMDALESNLSTLLDAMDMNCGSIEGVLSSTQSLQRMTVPFNHARNRLAGNLRAYLIGMKSTRDVVEQALRELKALRGK